MTASSYAMQTLLLSLRCHRSCVVISQGIEICYNVQDVVLFLFLGQHVVASLSAQAAPHLHFVDFIEYSYVCCAVVDEAYKF